LLPVLHFVGNLSSLPASLQIEWSAHTKHGFSGRLI
jgi:hypothetical protein